jgi:diguanylate cyclase (GGDEF)-like protein/PAS domain S-box-containing protein
MLATKNWLVKLVEFGLLPTDDADLRLKKIALTLVPLIIGPFAFAWGSIYFLLGHPLSASIPMSYSIISAASLAYFFKTKHTQFIQYSQLTLVLLLPFLLMWSLGGFSAGSMVMIWAIFAPIAAVIFLERRSALTWFFMYFGLILISVLINDYVAAATTPLPDLAIRIFYLLNLGFGSAGLYLLVSYSINEGKKAFKSDLRIAARAFEAQEGLMITDANGVILRINQAFTKTTGFSVEDVVGQIPSILKSDRHDEDFYHTMWESISQTGAWQGEIWNRRKNGEIHPEWLTISAVKGDDGIVTHYVSAHQDITGRKAAEEKILQLAFYDPLTQLPNRQLLLDRIQRAIASSTRSGRKGALMFIDMDNFKAINDTLGHATGDLLLQQVADRLISCVRESDTVARLGGDEFVVLVENLSEHSIEVAAQTEAVGEKILAALSQAYKLNERVFRSSSSIGATLFNGEQHEVEELLKQADIAMYQAKKAGRNALRFFDPEMQRAINARAALEGELYKALEQKQFHLYYQIQVDSSRRPVGAEALIRWLHPEHGLVSPAQFIPLAEETGLILPIGKWVLETACAQLKAWERDELTRNLVLAVNISAKQFHQADFVAQVRSIVQHYAIQPNLMKLEPTESLLLENTQDTVSTMKGLKAIGIQLSLDDFGTGYSSLQYLKLLPLDQIKIDQSFVRDIVTDPNDAAIVKTIIAMTKSLGLDVIAEGVETDAQREFLDVGGCHTYQGYLFGKPVPIEQFEASLKLG